MLDRERWDKRPAKVEGSPSNSRAGPSSILLQNLLAEIIAKDFTKRFNRAPRGVFNGQCAAD
jgi:hypothetical protein